MGRKPFKLHQLGRPGAFSTSFLLLGDRGEWYVDCRHLKARLMKSLVCAYWWINMLQFVNISLLIVPQNNYDESCATSLAWFKLSFTCNRLSPFWHLNYRAHPFIILSFWMRYTTDADWRSFKGLNLKSLLRALSSCFHLHSSVHLRTRKSYHWTSPPPISLRGWIVSGTVPLNEWCVVYFNSIFSFPRARSFWNNDDDDDDDPML